MRRPPRGLPLFWYAVSVVLGVVLVAGGLAVIAYFVSAAVAVNSYASNK